MTSLLFARFSAPDLALTQLLVEIVTVILILLAMYFLPQAKPARSSLARRSGDAALGVLAGILPALEAIRLSIVDALRRA